MNDELICRKRADGMRLMIKSQLEELTCLSEIIATEVIRVKPGRDCYWFIYRLLQAMIKTEDAIRACALLEIKDAKLDSGEWRGPNHNIKPFILDYYIKESLEHYLRNGLAPPVSAVPGCDGCQDVAPDERQPALHRSHTVGDVSEVSGLETRRDERQQSWHVLHFPETLQVPMQKAEQVDEIVEVQEDPMMDVAPDCPEDQEEQSSPSAPPTSPRI